MIRLDTGGGLVPPVGNEQTLQFARVFVPVFYQIRSYTT
jgi:hypothetical protein